MKSPFRQAIAFASTLALLSAAVAPLSTSDAADDTGAFDPSAILQSTPPQTGELLAFDMNRIVLQQQMRFVRYEATEYQRKVAEQRARAFVAAQRRAIAKAQPPAPPKTVAKKTEKPEKPGPSEKPAKPSKPEKPKAPEPAVAEKPKELPRYIAVDTVKDKRASPKAKKVIMIWDTHSESFVGNNVYDVENPPPVGAKTLIETYSAEYIGAGL